LKYWKNFEIFCKENWLGKIERYINLSIIILYNIIRVLCLTWIVINMPDDIDKEIGMYKAKQGLSSKEDAINLVLSKFFHVKIKILKEVELEGHEFNNVRKD
jgi:hypothetical protein